MKVFSFRVKKQGFFKRAGVNLVIFSMLLTVFAFTYAGGTMQVFNTQNGAEAIYYGNRSSNNISLMFNVYWGDEFLDGILKTLDEHDAKVTFFVGGVWASKNEEMLKRFVQEGHELANHGYNHKDQNRISQQENYNEINQTHQIVKSFTGLEMKLFAPPSGAFNDTTLNVAESLGYRTIMWTRDTIDWRDKDKQLIYNRAVKDAKGGDLVLMHPTEKTLEALPEILQTLKKQGLNVTTVSETIA